MRQTNAVKYVVVQFSEELVCVRLDLKAAKRTHKSMGLERWGDSYEDRTFVRTGLEDGTPQKVGLLRGLESLVGGIG